MTTRDTLEQILELHEEVKKLDQMVVDMFNRVYADHLRKAREYYSDLPTSDIVQCKDCRWSEPNREGDYDCKCHIPIFRVDADDFCSYGERKYNE